MLQRDEAHKQETSTSTPTIAKPSPWSLSRSKDHRIVRVSRAFGGKDRHSKVCTVRGLRDRRVRLSVPTAIQLYDLQDRLGLNQPSKVVDWLLDAAKHEIDELPPLQFLPSMMGFQDFATYQQQSAKQGLLINTDESNGYDSFIRPPSSSWDHQQQSISLGLTANDQNLDLHNFGFLQSSGLLLSSSSSDQVLGYQHHHQAEMSNTTQPYFPHTS